MITRFRLWFSVFISFLALTLFAGTALAASTVVQSYATDSSLQVGTIVELKASSTNTVKPLPQTNAIKMFGVTVSAADTPVTLSSGSTANQSFVANGGTYSTLVSNQAGAIKTGDYITISSIDGVGMKAGEADSMVLGKAVAAFNGSSDSLGSATLSGGGQQKTVQLGRVAVSIDIMHNPLMQPSNVPSFLHHIAQSVSDKPVSAARVYLCLVMFIISAIIAGSLLYAGVRSSITAVGRNPLSKTSIVRSLVQVILTSLIIFILGLFAVYLLLRF